MKVSKAFIAGSSERELFRCGKGYSAVPTFHGLLLLEKLCYAVFFAGRYVFDNSTNMIFFCG
jgi:hypothetical protein